MRAALRSWSIKCLMGCCKDVEGGCVLCKCEGCSTVSDAFRDKTQLWWCGFKKAMTKWQGDWVSFCSGVQSLWTHSGFISLTDRSGGELQLENSDVFKRKCLAEKMMMRSSDDKIITPGELRRKRRRGGGDFHRSDGGVGARLRTAWRDEIISAQTPQQIYLFIK